MEYVLYLAAELSYCTCHIGPEVVCGVRREQWMECARQAFAALDTDDNGLVTAAEFLNLLRDKLPASEIEYAVEDALLDAGQKGTQDEQMDRPARCAAHGAAAHHE
jgi:EF-hand domain